MSYGETTKYSANKKHTAALSIEDTTNYVVMDYKYIVTTNCVVIKMFTRLLT